MAFAPKYRDILFGPVSVLPSNKSGEQWLFVGLFSRSVSFSLERRMLGEVSFELGTPKTTRNDMLTKTGWWLSPTPLKNMNVSWDDSSQLWNNKIHVPSHQATNMLYTKKSKKLRFRQILRSTVPSDVGIQVPAKIIKTTGQLLGGSLLGSLAPQKWMVLVFHSPTSRLISTERLWMLSAWMGIWSPSYPLEIAMAHRNSWFTH